MCMAVCGPVGSGKSSLLMSLLNEMPDISGKLDIKGKMFYVSQEPWLFPGTIKENILFGKEYNQVKFKEIIKACFLTQVNLNFKLKI